MKPDDNFLSRLNDALYSGIKHDELEELSKEYPEYFIYEKVGEYYSLTFRNLDLKDSSFETGNRSISGDASARFEFENVKLREFKIFGIFNVTRELLIKDSKIDEFDSNNIKDLQITNSSVDIQDFSTIRRLAVKGKSSISLNGLVTNNPEPLEFLHFDVESNIVYGPVTTYRFLRNQSNLLGDVVQSNIFHVKELESYRKIIKRFSGDWWHLMLNEVINKNGPSIWLPIVWMTLVNIFFGILFVF